MAKQTNKQQFDHHYNHRHHHYYDDDDNNNPKKEEDKIKSMEYLVEREILRKILFSKKFLLLFLFKKKPVSPM